MNESENLKKRLSVNLLKAINKPLEEYRDFFRIKDDRGKFSLCLIDNDTNSDFYFGISKESVDVNGHNITYSCKPANSSNIYAISGTVKLDIFVSVMTNWLNNLKYYEEESILNDTLIKGYRDEFYLHFKILDEEANRHSFNYKQQKQLIAFFGIITDEFGKQKNETNANFIETIQNDFLELQNSVTSETKNGLLKKFSLVLAKIRKQNMESCDFIIDEFNKGFIKQAGGFTFDFIREHAKELPEFIGQVFNSLTN